MARRSNPLWSATTSTALAVAGIAGVVQGCHDEDELPSDCRPEVMDSLFASRIEPILTDDNPTSCNQCHLSGVDLGMFVRDTPCQTMACLQSQGLVDFESPESSVLLDWIERAAPESDLITEEVIQAEYDAVLSWIEFSATCQAEACGEIDNPCDASEPPTCDLAQPSSVFDDPGDCSPKTLEALFFHKVYSYRNRCFPCHFDGSLGDEFPDAPNWVIEGSCEAGNVESMRNILELRLVDLDDPAQSLLIQKPLAEELGGLEHGGGDKFHDETDPAYPDFLLFATRYAECATGDLTLSGAETR